ncbi:response regulator, partial [Methylobacterium frigidaeris]
AEMLADGGCQVRQARSGEEALKLLELERVDVLLTDVGLPGISGLELARTARERWPDISVVLASGDSAVSSDAAFLRASLVVKPYTPESLRQTIAKSLFMREPSKQQR